MSGRNLILTSYLTSGIDTQRNVYHPTDDASKLALIAGAERLALDLVILHDRLSVEFCRLHTTRHIAFVRVADVPAGLTVYSYRHVAQLQYLLAHPHDSVFCTGLFDVQLQLDPHALIDDSRKIWAAREPEIISHSTAGGRWIIGEFMAGYGYVPPEIMEQPLLNADIWGARYDQAIPFLQCFVAELRRSTAAMTDMAAFNHACYVHLGVEAIWNEGPPLHSEFKRYETRSDVAFIHK